jgi:hypothetical protein
MFDKLFNKIFKITKSYTNGTTIGIIKSKYNEGLLFKPEYISVCETSTFVHKYSTFFLSNNEKKQIEFLIKNQTPVCLHFSINILGFPHKGQFIGQQYVHKIEPLQGRNNTGSPTTFNDHFGKLSLNL